MLKPDKDTLQPRLIVHTRCKDTAYQVQRFVWDNFSTKIDKDQKQTPKPKYDDYPAMLRYLANSEPNFRFLKSGPAVMSRPSKRKKAYG